MRMMTLSLISMVLILSFSTKGWADVPTPCQCVDHYHQTTSEGMITPDSNCNNNDPGVISTASLSTLEGCATYAPIDCGNNNGDGTEGCPLCNEGNGRSVVCCSPRVCTGNEHGVRLCLAP